MQEFSPPEILHNLEDCVAPKQENTLNTHDPMLWGITNLQFLSNEWNLKKQPTEFKTKLNAGKQMGPLESISVERMKFEKETDWIENQSERRQTERSA